MVSEDSQYLGRFPVVHRLLDLGDLHDPRHREVPAEFHQLDDSNELLEVLPLRSSQWVLLEERNDLGAEILKPVDVKPKEILPVVVTSPIPIDPPATEKVDQSFQRVTTRLSLYDIEGWPHLPLESHLVTTVDGAAEAAFPIHEAHDPSDGLEPFLLVFRTRRIVTVHVTTVSVGSDTAGTARYTGFPAYSRLRTARSPVRGAASPACLGTSYLRHICYYRSIAQTKSVLEQRGGHFCRPPHVAMRVGLYLRRELARGARRAVSEGSRWTSLLIVRTARIVTSVEVPSDARSSQHTAEFCNGL
jgi:hypothetical protein